MLRIAGVKSYNIFDFSCNELLTDHTFSTIYTSDTISNVISDTSRYDFFISRILPSHSASELLSKDHGKVIIGIFSKTPIARRVVITSL